MQDPTTQIKELVLCQASENVDDHPIREVVESATVSATAAACRSSHELLDWDEYREVAL